MILLLVSLLLAALMMVAISLEKTYNHLPQREFKRRAAQGDQVAALLYRAVAYGVSLNVLVWLFIGLSAAGFFVALSHALPTTLALLGSLTVLWLGFAWLPNTRVTALSIWLARAVTPIFAWILNYTAPLFDRLASFFEKHAQLHVHTGLFQKEDLIDLIEQQKVQADNRMAEEELSMAKHVLTFGDKLVSDILIPQRIVKSVKASDTIGPILMGELHDSGHSRFPVYQDKPAQVVGMLYLRDLLDAKQGGLVSSVMQKRVYYMHEDQSLYEALTAFLKTKHHMFVVVNSFEEVVGVVTIEDVLEQIIGKPIVDEFDQYDDLRAVAARLAEKEHAEHPEPSEAEKSTQESSEVVE